MPPKLLVRWLIRNGASPLPFSILARDQKIDHLSLAQQQNAFPPHETVPLLLWAAKRPKLVTGLHFSLENIPIVVDTPERDAVVVHVLGLQFADAWPVAYATS